MSAAAKGFYFRRLKGAGVDLSAKHFRDYTTEELKNADDMAVSSGLLAAPTEQELTELEAKVHRKKTRDEPPITPSAAAQLEGGAPEDPELADFFGYGEPAPVAAPAPVRPELGEMAGERQNTKDVEEILYVDDEGRAWLQKEVLKPAFPKPRGRRVLRYQDPGVKQTTIKEGEYTETFEVAGDARNATPSEIKITLPSYQVGIYRDPRFPFKVITYNGKSGFDRMEVEKFFGGAEMVPPTAKRAYVENVLCYDMRSVIRAVNDEYRQLQLAAGHNPQGAQA